VLLCNITTGGGRCHGGEDVMAARECTAGRYPVQHENSRGSVTEQSIVSRDDWETMVRYNEKILQKENLENFATITTTTAGHQPERPENILRPIPRQTTQSCPVSWRSERPSFKPPKPPKPTSPQRTSKHLLPVQQFLNRQVMGKNIIIRRCSMIS